MTRRASAVALAAILAAAVGVGVAYATRTIRIKSHISISSHGLTFKGRVTSPKSQCEPSRTVTLHRTNGNRLGTTHTNASGRWTITASGSAGISLGHFYATVKRLSQGTAGTIYVCKAARSKTIAFH